MKILDTEISEVKIIKPTIYEDERGHFFEAYNASKFKRAFGFVPIFCQLNQSYSKKGVVRGLHIQKKPFTQAKLVSVISGKALDVVVDCRKNSPDFGKHVSVELSAENKYQIWMPRGFAHGFQALSDHCTILYQVDNKFDQESQVSINPFDKHVAVKWREGLDLCLSEQDSKGISFDDFERSLVTEKRLIDASAVL